jgi:hypothetical protein
MADDPIQQGADYNNQLSGDPNNETDTVQQVEAYAMAQYQKDPNLQAYVRNAYGYESWMLNNPELLPILVSAATNNWGQGRIDGALYATNWWQQNSQSIRDFAQLQGTDPATAQQQVDIMRNTIISQAQGIGVQLSDDQINNLASQATQWQWDAATIDQELRQSYVAQAPNQTSGGAAEIAQAVRNVGGQYLSPMSDQAVSWWTTTAIQKGEDATALSAQLSNVLATQAKQMYPWLSSAIDNGMTPKQFLDPYTQQAAKTLSISPDSIDWTSPKWQGALLQTAPDGSSTPVNSDQFNKNLMQNQAFGFSKTQPAIDQAYSAVHTIAQTFGALKT